LITTFFVGVIIVLIVIYVNKYKYVDQNNSERLFVESGDYNSVDALKIGGF
jgi:uncharacterized membrane protein